MAPEDMAVDSGEDSGEDAAADRKAGGKGKKGKRSYEITEAPGRHVARYDPVQRYLAEVRRYRLLTREEEKDLATRFREHGDQDAALRLVTSNLRLVVKIALDFQRIWMQNLSDLIQEGNMGLMMAVKNFDPHKNVKFSYYSSFWIKAYILKFIMDNWRLVKIGTTQGQRKLFFKLKKEKQSLIDQGFDPQPKLISERLGVPEKEVVEMEQRLGSWDLSLDAPVSEDSDAEQIGFFPTHEVSAEDRVAEKQVADLLRDHLPEFTAGLNDREREIFRERIFTDTPLTLQEMGDRYGISRERVRQVENNIIRKMKSFFRERLPDYDIYGE